MICTFRTKIEEEKKHIFIVNNTSINIYETCLMLQTYFDMKKVSNIVKIIKEKNTNTKYIELEGWLTEMMFNDVKKLLSGGNNI